MTPAQAQELFDSASKAVTSLRRAEAALRELGDLDLADSIPRVVLHLQRMLVVPAAVLVRETAGDWPDGVPESTSLLEAGLASQKQAAPAAAAFELGVSVARDMLLGTLE